MAITLRSDKGLPLTYTELDQNFDELNHRLAAIELGTALSVNGQKGNVQLTTTEIPEGNNLYFTNLRVDAHLANITTDSLPEGSNLYYTNARARNSLSSGTGISYSNVSGQISLNANTSIVSEGTNLYFTNARVDSRIAATSVNALSDVNWAGTPTTNHVLTWTGTQWEPQVAPGASGGEANDGVNLGTGQGIFAGKVGVNLRFYTLAGDNSVKISSPASNVITISLNNAISTDSITSVTTNGNLTLTPNGTGIVVADNLAVSSLTAGRIPYVTTNKVLTDNANLTFDGSVLTSLTPTGTAPFVVNSTTRVSNLNVSFAGVANTVNNAAQPNITSVGNLTIANIDNIQINGNTVSSTDTNGNIYLTPSGSGEVVASSLSISDLTTGRIPYVNTNSSIVDSANLAFDGTTLTLIGNANINNALISNIQIYGNEIEAMNTNGNLYLTPNGTGRLGVGTFTPVTLLDVNGTVTSTGLTVNGSMTLGASSANTISLTGRFSSSLIPSTSSTYDIGSSANRFRAGYFSGNVDLNGQIVSSASTGTAPFVVTSTTQVANLNVATAGTAGTVTTAAQPNITSVGTLTSLAVTQSSISTAVPVTNVSTTWNNASVTFTGMRFNATDTASAAGSLLEDLQVGGVSKYTVKKDGNVNTVGSFISNVATGTAPLVVTSTTQVANLNVATAGTAGTVTTAAQPNITSVGTLTSLGVSGAVTASTLVSNVTTGTAPFTVTSTTQVANLNVATAGTAGTVTTAAQPNITSTGTLTSLTIAAGNATVAPMTLTSGTVLTTAAAGRVEYDGTYFYLTPETTAGRGHVPALQTFRLAANGTAISTIADFFGATSSINLAATSVYEITYHAYGQKATAGTMTWTLLASSAPTLISANYISGPITGIAAGAPTTGYTGATAGTTTAFAATGSISNNAFMSFAIKAYVITNLATNLRLQLACSAGSFTPTAGSYYTVQRISTSTGAFA